MNLTVNGKPQQVDSTTTISQLLDTLKLDPERAAVEHNLNVVARSDFDKTSLTEGDSLEIVQFVGGG